MSGRTIVLIRGLLRNQFHWGEFRQYLAGRLHGDQVICADVAGTGTRHKLVSPGSVEEMVEDLRRQVGAGRKIDLVTLSMGGMIGLKWAERYPDEVASLVCINTTAANFSPAWQRLRPRAWPCILLALLMPSRIKERIVYTLVSNRQPDRAVLEHWVWLDKQYPVTAGNACRQLVAASRFRAVKVNCHLLFISSRQDHLVSGAASMAMAKAWHAARVVNDADGHDIALDNPVWLGDQLTLWYEFVAGIRPQPFAAH